jgi:heme a synthase
MLNNRFARFAWFFVGYLIVVILFGAWVRISGAGNGCGSHWPTCNGDVIPQAPSTKTIIEYSHRLTSGLCGIFALVLVFWSRRVGRSVFCASLVTFFFLLVESFIGAVLVKKELVAGDASASRAVVVSLHLANTMLLMASAATVAWWSSRNVPAGRPRFAKPLIVAVLVALVLANMSGAVTALGDTLFPTRPALDGSLLAKVQADVSPTQHFLVRLRMVHPVVASAAAALLAALFLGLLRGITPAQRTHARLFRLGLIVISGQVVLGVINVALAAPAWMQIVHLLSAQIVWIVAWVATLEIWPARLRVV